MALHTDLPIYKVGYDLLGVAVDSIKDMPRDVKQALGSKIRDECIDSMLLIRKANIAADKEPHLLSLLERLEVVELLVRVSRDKRFITTKRYAAVIELTQRIGKQANGWRNQQRLLHPRQGEDARA